MITTIDPHILKRSSDLSGALPLEIFGTTSVTSNIINRYDSLIIRRKLARFDTPRPLSQALVDWAVRSTNDSIFEPSSGSGVFVHSAIHRLRLLNNPNPKKNIWACDIDPIACQQTRIDAELQARQVWNADLMTLVSSTGINKKTFDVIIGNPPFLKLHAMSEEQRRTARAAADRLNWPLDHKASLWAYFAIACTRALVKGGRLCLILPQSALHAGYARDVMHGVSRHFRRSMIVSLREACFASAGTKERTVVFFGENYEMKPRASSDAALVECVDIQAVKTFLASSRSPAFAQVPKLNGHVVPHLLSSSATAVMHLEDVPYSVPLGDFIEVKIGAVTGANHFFILNEEDRRRLRLPPSSVIPIIQKYPIDVGMRMSRPLWKRLRDRGDRCWLFFPEVDDQRHSVRAYLNTFTEAAITANRTFSKRAYWYRTTLTRPPDAYLKYLGSTGPRFALATFSCQCTNTIHAIYFNAHVTPTQRRAITLSTLSSFSLLSAEFEGRSYGTDALKLEPSEAKRMRILLPPKLNKRKISRLFSAVHAVLIEGKDSEATALVDEWLYETIPGIRTHIPIAKITRILEQARLRRRTQLLFTPQRGR